MPRARRCVPCSVAWGPPQPASILPTCLLRNGENLQLGGPAPLDGCIQVLRTREDSATLIASQQLLTQPAVEACSPGCSGLAVCVGDHTAPTCLVARLGVTSLQQLAASVGGHGMRLPGAWVAAQQADHAAAHEPRAGRSIHGACGGRVDAWVLHSKAVGQVRGGAGRGGSCRCSKEGVPVAAALCAAERVRVLGLVGRTKSWAVSNQRLGSRQQPRAWQPPACQSAPNAPDQPGDHLGCQPHLGCQLHLGCQPHLGCRCASP